MPKAAYAVTDIQGSTELWERLGPAFAPALSDHNRIVREAIAESGGTVLRTEGDSFAAEFPGAAAALRFAIATQERLHAHSWPLEAGELLVRIGVYAGPAEEVQAAGAASRRSGAALAMAAAVSAAGHGGQIVATKETVDAAGVTTAVLADLGEHRLSATTARVRLVQVLPESLASRTFPPPRTESALLTNISRETNAFVGRETELRELQALLPIPAGRLITLTGTGGIGKSRLACHAAISLLPRFPGGVWFADVSEARSPADVARAAAAALGIPLAGRDDPPRAVAAALEFRKPLLLILDSFEGAVAHASATVGLWTKSARDARFLVTSRTLLHLSGEREIALGPLPAPPRPARDGTRRQATAQLAGFDSVRLFVARALEHSPAFALTAENAGAISEICSRLEGIPLAVEIAAAHLRDASPARIVEQLRARIGSIEHSAAGSGTRRQTLTGTLEWTYSELADWERSAFRQACVFRGGFFLEAAETVVDLSDFPDAPLAIDAIQSLRDRSLLRSWDTPFGTRFGMFATVREFGERHGAEGAAEAERRHATCFSTYGEQWRARLTSPDGVEALRRLTLEEENFLRAAEWGLARGEEAGRDLAAQSVLAWSEVALSRGPYSEVRPWCEAVLKQLPGRPVLRTQLLSASSRADFYLGNMGPCLADAEQSLVEARASGSPGIVARGMVWLARVLTVTGDMKRSRALYDEAEALARQAGDLVALSNAHGMRGTLFHELRDFEAQGRDFAEAVRLARQSGNPLALARHLTNSGSTYRYRGEPDAALAVYDEAERIFLEAGNTGDAGSVAANRGIILFEKGDSDGAKECFLRALEAYRLVGYRQQIALTLGNLGSLYGMRGEHAEGLRLAGEAVAVARELGTPQSCISALTVRSTLLGAAKRYGESLADANEVLELGRSRGLDHVIPPAARLAATSQWHLGRLVEARTLLAEGLRHCDPGQEDANDRALIQATLALIEKSAGRMEEARAAAELARAEMRTLNDRQKKAIADEQELIDDMEKILDSPP